VAACLLSSRCSDSRPKHGHDLRRLGLIVCANAAIGFPNFNLPALNSGFKAWLGMHGWTVHYMTIVNGKPGAMPGALNRVSLKFAFG
jgi:hypothetical protein